MVLHQTYKNQVQLLLDVLPEVAKETCFALHGGTAINLFVRNMPRLSVDIDLTYIPIEGRQTSITSINTALSTIKAQIERIKPLCQISHNADTCKLLISEQSAQIKIEVNTVSRGVIAGVQKHLLCHRAQEMFDAFCSVQMVSIGQLFGGKICAALDRQHPRDLFDIKLMLENEGLTDEIKQGFIYALLSSVRPMHEIFDPNLLDQRQLFETHFDGMTGISFTYDDFETTRLDLLKRMNAVLSREDREFILGVNRLAPDWSRYPFGDFASVRWKLRNLENLKTQDVAKYEAQCQKLISIMSNDDKGLQSKAAFDQKRP